MYDTVSTALEGAEEGGKHRGGLFLGVVEEHDPAAGCLDSFQHLFELSFRRHRIPVARPQVRAEHHDAATFESLEQLWRGSKSRKTEERRRWRAAGLAVKGGIDGREPAIDLGLGGGDRHAVEQRMDV